MKFFESGKMDQVMPSGHMAHALPRENFQAKALPQAHATVPNNDDLARTHAIIQQLRSIPNGQAHGLSPAGPTGQGVRGPRTFLSGPRQVSRSSGPLPAPQRSRF
jgi:hypothetical protein